MAIAYKRIYRFFLQNRYNIGQTCLSFHNDGTVSLKVVPSLGEIKAIDLAKKDTPAQTLAYFDSLTTSTTDLSSFLESIETDHPDLGFYSGNFKLEKTYIGYFYNYSMRRMTPVYDDENLKSVALGAEGSEVGRDDEFAYSFMNEVISRITDPNNPDYAQTLVATALKNNGFEGGYEYSITKDITNTITSLHNACINSSMYSSFALDEDISAWEADLKQKMQQYKVFRELYRFTKAYDLATSHKKEEEPSNAINPVETPNTIVVKQKLKSLGTIHQFSLSEIFPEVVKK